MLVEGDRSDTDVLKPDRTPLGSAWNFYLLDADHNVTRTWTTQSVSVQEHLSSVAHVVEADELICYFHDAAWGHEDRPTLHRSVELDGLRLLRSPEAPAEQAVRTAIDRYETAKREAWAEHEQAESDRLARFERALPSLASAEQITLVWRYDGPDVVVSRSTGEEVWREADWPFVGKALYERLARVAAAKYGDGLAGFEVDVPAQEYVRFDND